MRRAIVACLMVMLCTGAGAGVAAQSEAKDETKKAGRAIKDAGKDTGDAAKHAGKATAKATKKGANAVKKAVTGDTHAMCADLLFKLGRSRPSRLLPVRTMGASRSDA